MELVIRKAIEEALQDLGQAEVAFVVEHPADMTHGDYASNVAMVLAKQVGESPRDFASKLAKKLTDQIEYVSEISVAGPGFLNFHLHRDFFTREVARAAEQGEGWGKNESWASKRVVVEYTDPNPFKEFHIGHMFTNAVGESIARLFMMNGADTKRVNYQGDVGLHVACAVWGMQKLDITVDTDIDAKVLGRAYSNGATAYREDASTQSEIRTINKHIYEQSNAEIMSLYKMGRAVSLEYFEGIYQILGTEFDEYFFESEAGPLGKQVVLEHSNTFRESDGARVFKGEEYDLHTRVFLNKEGLPTYEAKELALAKLKEERLGGYDHSVISTANEINEYFKVLLKAMSFVYPELANKTEHIGHGMVRLATGKMSSRTGDVIPAVDFMAEITEAAKVKVNESSANGSVSQKISEQTVQDIAIAAIKYATLRGSIKQDSVFDKTQALSFEGDSGPYLQYTHARILSVLEKAAGVGVVPDIAVTPDEPYAVERLVYQFPEVIEMALKERAPHHVATYLTQLAGAFNTFYATEKIADPNDEYAPYKAAVADAVRITLKNGLWVLGIKAPDRL